MKNTTRKILSLILCFIMLLGAAPLNGIAELDFSKLNIFGGINLPDLSSLFTPKASAENVTSGTCGDNLTWELDEETRTLTISGEGIMTGTFSEDTRIKNVIIESGVTGISQGAFSWCDKLTSVSIPDSVTSIGAGAFSRCTMLSEITIPKGISDLGSGMLFGCTGLTILNYNAKECSGYGFIPPELQQGLGNPHWLSGCENLKTINIGSVVEKIPWCAFSGCTGLETIYYNAVDCSGRGFSNGMYNWLSGSENIETVYLGDNVKNIPEYAFYNCTEITEITIPDSVENIGDNAFSGCTGLTTVEIGSGVTSIDESVFSGCTGLTDIYFNGSEEDWYSITNGSLSSFVIHFNDGHYINADSGKLAYSIKDEEAVITGIKSPLDGGILVIPEILDGYRVTGIGSFAFHNCTGLASITIPNSVTSIGEGAFDGCTGLTSVTFGESVKNIGEGAFLYCDGLTKVNYTGTVADWCSISFSRGSNPAYYSQSLYINDIQLTEITEADLIGVTSISDYAFDNNTVLESVTIPDSVMSIGRCAFLECTELISAEIGSGVASIGDSAFAGCWSMESISVSDGNNAYHSAGNCLIDKNRKTLIAGCKNSVIPDDGSVTSIGGWAFSGYEELTSITIPDGVTSIGGRAFCSCTGLTEITIPESVTSIENDAFAGCTALETINYNAINCTGYGFSEEYYSNWLFGCDNIKTVNIGDSVETIPEYAFYNCTGLTEITIPESVTSIDNKAFSGCAALETVNYNAVNCSGRGFSSDYNWLSGCGNIKTVNIGDSVETIPDYAFYNCTGLTEITIPGSVKSIGNGAFSWCTGLTSITIPDSVTSIGNYAFEGCTGLTSITIPDSVTSISNYAFSGCTGLTSITIPDGVTSICDSAFDGCTGLTSITIGNGVTRIGDSAFTNCSGLTDIYYNGNEESWYSIEYVYGLSSIVIHFKDGRFINANSNNLLYTIENNGEVTITGIMIPVNGAMVGIPRVISGRPVTDIKKDAFKNRSDIMRISLPDSIRNIGDSAFSGCTGLTEITIPESVTSIGKNAFSGCTALETVNYNAVNCSGGGFFSSINDWFSGCEKLNTVTIGDSVETIPAYAFSGCTELTEITIPGSVTSIGNQAFSGCTALETVNYNAVNCSGGGFSGINNWLSGCDNLETVTIGEKVKTIPAYAFYNCTGLTEITIPGSVTSIGNQAFSGCKALETVNYNAVNCSNYNFFQALLFHWLKGCTNLKYINVGDKVERIPDYAFWRCTGLTEITIPDSVTSIGNYAFEGCTGLTSITVSEGNIKYHSAGNCLIETAGKTLILGCKNSIIPDDGSVTSIGGYAFYDCTGLTSITIPDSIENIGADSFHNIPDIHYSENMTAAGSPWGARSVNGYVDGYLVYNDESKTELRACSSSARGTVVIPASVKRICDKAFYACGGIERVIVKIRDSEPEWGKDVFLGCYNLKSVDYLPYGSGEHIKGDIIFGDNGKRLIFCNKDRSESYTIPNEVTVIEDNAFYNCKDIPSITMNDNLLKIGAHAFEGTALYDDAARDENGALYLGGNNKYLIDVKKEDLTNFEIREGTAVIAAGAFSECGELTSVSLPSSIKGIGHDAFSGCEKLETVTVDEDNEILYAGEDAFKDTPLLNNTEGALYVGSALVKAGNPGGSFEINGGTTCVADCAFAGSDSLTSVSFPASMRIIGSRAFADCTSLTAVTLPERVTEIGNYAFRGCDLSGEISLPSSLNKIGACAFYGCKQIEVFKAENNAVYYSKDGVLFERVKAKDESEKITLLQYPAAKQGDKYEVPAGVSKIANYAFSYAGSLTTVKIGENTSYNSLSFKYCNAVRYTAKLVNGIQLSDDGTVLVQVTAEALDEDGAFTVPESVIAIAPGSFDPVSDKIASVNLNKTRIINDGVFDGCENLEAVTGAENLLWIGDRAFYGCKKLAAMEIPSDAFKLPSSFNEETEISYTGDQSNSRRIVIENESESGIILTGQSIRLKAAIQNGEKLAGEEIIWLDADTGEKLGEGESLTIKEVTRNMKITAVLKKEGEDFKENTAELESEAVTIPVCEITTEPIPLEDENGKQSSEITAVKNEPRTVILTLVNPLNEKLDDKIEIHWFLDGKEKTDSRGTVCEVKDKTEDFKVYVEFRYKDITLRKTKEYTVKINEINIPDNPVIPDIEIKNFKENLKVDYKAKVTVGTTINAPEGYEIVWQDGTKGPVYTIGQATQKEYMIQAKLVRLSDGKTVKSTSEETVTVNTGFFAKIIAFFRSLFKALPEYADNKKVK